MSRVEFISSFFLHRLTILVVEVGLTNLVMLAIWIFSSVFFSASSFPEAIQPFVQALRRTTLNDPLRGNMLQGVG